MPDGSSLIGAESIIKSLANSGPWGILCAVLLMALIACFMAWRTCEKELRSEIRKGSDALHQSSEAMRDSNTGRGAMIEAMGESHRMNKEVLGKLERQSALLDSIDRTLAIQAATEGKVSRR